MYLAKRFSEEQREITERVKSGADEAVFVGDEREKRELTRRERIKRDVGKELRALRTLSGAMKGAVTRRNWPLWSAILEQVKVEVYED
tara:strand:+ start:201 stop:464 length:264 start_codon:yes stop_codon:yes gene_type:complete